MAVVSLHIYYVWAYKHADVRVDDLLHLATELLVGVCVCTVSISKGSCDSH